MKGKEHGNPQIEEISRTWPNSFKSKFPFWCCSSFFGYMNLMTLTTHGLECLRLSLSPTAPRKDARLQRNWRGFCHWLVGIGGLCPLFFHMNLVIFNQKKAGDFVWGWHIPEKSRWIWNFSIQIDLLLGPDDLRVQKSLNGEKWWMNGGHPRIFQVEQATSRPPKTSSLPLLRHGGLKMIYSFWSPASFRKHWFGFGRCTIFGFTIYHRCFPKYLVLFFSGSLGVVTSKHLRQGKQFWAQDSSKFSHWGVGSWERWIDGYLLASPFPSKQGLREWQHPFFLVRS